MLIMLAETMRCLSCVGPVLGMHHSIYVCTADVLVILPSSLHTQGLAFLCLGCVRTAFVARARVRLCSTCGLLG